VPVTVSPRAGRGRREADRRAATRARSAALRMIDYDPDAARVSISHSAGAGAAIVAPAPWTVGVDIMPLGRVGARHATAILAAEEVDLLRGIPPSLAPTVAWTIKEAAAKASARADSLSLTDFRIRTCSVDGEAVVQVADETGERIAGGWGMECAFVYAWGVRSA
jgi:4'-phosphopantetheinyl transferase EntD